MKKLLWFLPYYWFYRFFKFIAKFIIKGNKKLKTTSHILACLSCIGIVVAAPSPTEKCHEQIVKDKRWDSVTSSEYLSSDTFKPPQPKTDSPFERQTFVHLKNIKGLKDGSEVSLSTYVCIL